jgi:hypothetical protein
MTDQAANQPDAPHEGSGVALFNADAGTARDTRLVRRAIQGGWPINAELRELIVAKLGDVIRDPKTSARELVNASKAVIGADGLNVQIERLAAAQQQPPPSGKVLVIEDAGWYGSPSVGASVQAALAMDPNYLEWIRERELSEPEPLNGKTPYVDRN